MVHLVIIALGLVVQSPVDWHSRWLRIEDLRGSPSQASHHPSAHVKLALWCERAALTPSGFATWRKRFRSIPGTRRPADFWG